MKKVSVCMLARNTGSYISQAIESVLSQKTDFDYEIVIAEDQSTDNTKQIAKEYKSRYPEIIKLIENPVNLGMSANYVNAFKNCSAEYITILDSDDYWSDPLKMQKQVDFLEKNREYGVVYTDCGVINESGNEIEWEEMDYYRQLYSSGNLFFKLLEDTFIPMLTTCFRKELISEEFEKSDLWFFEDWWLWMRLSIKSKIYFMNVQSGCYRLHAGNITKTRVENKKKLRQYKRKSYMIYYSNIVYFAGYNKQKLLRQERKQLTNKIMGLLYRRQGTIKMKMKLISLLIRYFPGFGAFSTLLLHKIRNGNPLVYKH